MQHLQLDTSPDLKALQRAYAQHPPTMLREFWLTNDGRHALAEANNGEFISLHPEETGLRLSQASHQHKLQDLAAWLQSEGKVLMPAAAEPPLDRPHPRSRGQLAEARDFYLNPDFLAHGWEALFPGHQGLNFEIGCGYGHFLAWLAPRHREQAFIGVDIVTKVLKRARRRLDKSGADNVILAKLDALLSLRELVAPASLDQLYILFPDPWPKNPRRRTLRPDTLPLFASRLKAGGRLLFVSDDPDYAADARNLLDADAHFTPVPFPPIEVKTKYEKKWLAQEKEITRLAYARVPVPELPDQAPWPGYAFRVHFQLPDWTPTAIERIYNHFVPTLLQHGPLTLKLDACYRASSRPALRLHLILAAPGTLAQHSWLELNANGQLAPASDSWLPFLSQRESILGCVANALLS